MNAPPIYARTRFAAINYRMRILASIFFPLILLSIPEDHLTFERRVLFVIAVAWPHVAYWHARLGADAEFSNMFIDSIFVGVFIAVVSFRLWPTASMCIIMMANLIAAGGPKLFLKGLAGIGIGLAIASQWLGPELHAESELLPTTLSIAVLVLYIGYLFYTAYRQMVRMQETRAALKSAERRASDLLLKILPESVIPRLQAGESPIADQFADVTVIFADIVGFTPLSEQLGPKRMVVLLNDLFGRFDQAARQLGVEKIETTGDGYLAVGGAPGALDRHPEAVAEFALAVIDAARRVTGSGAEPVGIRVGIHTGPVFAGVVGESRFHYKIFGETVNTASRIQGHAETGRVLVSEATYKRIRGAFEVEEHGVVELKGHGPMRTYWLLPLSPARA